MAICANCGRLPYKCVKFTSTCPNTAVTVHEALRKIFVHGPKNVLTPLKHRRQERRVLCRPCGGMLGRIVNAFKDFTDQMGPSTYMSKVVKQCPDQVTPAQPKKPRKVVRPSLSKNLRNDTTTKRGSTTFIAFLKQKIRQEMSVFVKTTSLRKQIASMEDLPDAGTLSKEIKDTAPTVYSAIMAISGTAKDKTLSVKAFCGLAVLAHSRSIHCNRVQKLIAVLLLKSRASNNTFQQFNRLGLSVSKQTINKTISVLSESFDSHVCMWRDDIELQLKNLVKRIDHPRLKQTFDMTGNTERIMSQQSGARKRLRYNDEEFHSFNFIMDNLNKTIHRRSYSAKSQSTSMDMTSYIAAESRIPILESDIFTEPSVKTNSDLKKSMFELTEQDVVLLENEHKVLIKRCLLDHLNIFHRLSLRKEEKHIPNEHTTLSSTKSKTVNLGIIMENENTTAGMMKILETIQKYHPTFPNADVMELVCWGDGLTANKIVKVIEHRAVSNNGEEFLSSSVPGIGHWHRRVLLFTDHMKTLLKDTNFTLSPGTLPNFRGTFSGHKSASLNQKKNFNETFAFNRFVWQSYVVALACKFLQLKNPLEVLKEYDLKTKEELGAVLEETVEKILNFEWHNVQRASLRKTVCICKKKIQAHPRQGSWLRCMNFECETEWFSTECYSREDGCTQEYVEEWTDDSDDDDMEEQTEDMVDFTEDVADFTEDMVDFTEDVADFTEDMVDLTEQETEGLDVDRDGRCKEINVEDRASENSKNVRTSTLWFCSVKCRASRLDRKLAYSKAVIFCGLINEGLRDAVRENDGPRLIAHTKLNLIQYIHKNHRVYKKITVNMLFNLVSHPSRIVRNDLLWNSTVNISGGVGKNIEMDLFNEMINKELKLFVFPSNVKTNEKIAVERSQAIGILKEIENEVKKLLGQEEKYGSGTTNVEWLDDVKKAVQILLKDELFDDKGFRYHYGFEYFNIDYMYVANMTKFRMDIGEILHKIDVVRNCESEPVH